VKIEEHRQERCAFVLRELAAALALVVEAPHFGHDLHPGDHAALRTGHSIASD
jgi:hypothetical protein